jgi:hypothetical protein
MQVKHIPDTWKIEKRNHTYAVWDENGDARCGALKRNKKPCMGRPVNGTLRCRIHPGLPVKGELHPTYKHGRYTSDTTPSLREQFKDFSDDDLLDLTENLRMVDLRLRDLFTNIEDGDFSASAKELRTQFIAAQNAYARDNETQFKTEFKALGAMIESAAFSYETWDELLKWNTARHNMTTGIHKMAKDNEGMLSVPVVVELFYTLIQAVLEHNTIQNESERRNAIRSSADRILSLPLKDKESS